MEPVLVELFARCKIPTIGNVFKFLDGERGGGEKKEERCYFLLYIVFFSWGEKCVYSEIRTE